MFCSKFNDGVEIAADMRAEATRPLTLSFLSLKAGNPRSSRRRYPNILNTAKHALDQICLPQLKAVRDQLMFPQTNDIDHTPARRRLATTRVPYTESESAGMQRHRKTHLARGQRGCIRRQVLDMYIADELGINDVPEMRPRNPAQRKSRARKPTNRGHAGKKKKGAYNGASNQRNQRQCYMDRT